MQVDRLSLLSAEPPTKEIPVNDSPGPLTPWESVQPPEIEALIQTPPTPPELMEVPIVDPPAIHFQIPPSSEPASELPESSGNALMLTLADAEQTESIEAFDQIEPAPALAPARKPMSGGLFTIPLLCLGIGLIALCVLIPAAEENHRLVYERERLQRDLDQISRQTDVNDEFLKHVADDAGLAERLAQRQMKMVRQGTSVLDLKGEESDKQMSPFGLLTLPPPAPLPPYQPTGGILSAICRNPHGQLYMTGAGLLLLAFGLVIGQSPQPTDDEN